MRFLQGIVSLLLTLIAGVAACIMIAWDKLRSWHQKRLSAINNARIKAEIQKLRMLANKQRDMMFRSRNLDGKSSDHDKIPWFVIAAWIGLAFMVCAVAGVIAAQHAKPRCGWKPRHANTLTENISGQLVCLPPASQEADHAQSSTAAICSPSGP